MPIQIGCPQPQWNILVSVQGSGSPGTICVYGTCQDGLARPPTLLEWLAECFKKIVRWLARLFRPEPAPPVGNGLFIRARVVSGWVGTGGLSPYYQAGDGYASPTPQWCAPGVQVPSGSTAGCQLTAVAWLLSGSDGTGLTVVDGPHVVPFYYGGSNAIDCCASCGSGSVSGSGPATSALAAALGAHPALEVTVPDGPNAGLHRARARAYLTWELAVGGRTYTVCRAGETSLLVRGPSASASPTAVEWGPFSAVFPGDVFGSAGDVVVTIA